MSCPPCRAGSCRSSTHTPQGRALGSGASPTRCPPAGTPPTLRQLALAGSARRRPRRRRRCPGRRLPPLERRGRVLCRTHHKRTVPTEGRFGVLSRAIGSIPADARGEPEGFFEEAQGGSGVSVAEVGVHRRRHAATSCWASGSGRAARQVAVSHKSGASKVQYFLRNPLGSGGRSRTTYWHSDPQRPKSKHEDDTIRLATLGVLETTTFGE